MRFPTLAASLAVLLLNSGCSKPAPKQAETLYDVYSYYANYSKNWKNKDVEAITTNWAPGYQDWFGGKVEGQRLPEGKAFGGKDQLRLQVNYTGEYGGTVAYYHVLSVTPKGETLIVKGRKGAILQIIDASGITNNRMNGDGRFTDVWKKDAKFWKLTETSYATPGLDNYEMTERKKNGALDRVLGEKLKKMAESAGSK